MFLDKLKSKGRRGWHSFASHFRSEHKPAVAVDGNLFPLPLELVEEIASYFTCSEALKVLTVNSVFHHAFSRVVWSHIHLSNANAHVIPKSAWKKYGHLVRTATVGLDRMQKLPAISMPNLVELDLYLGGDAYRLFERVELPHLRRLSLTLTYGKWTRADFKTGVDLAQRLKRTGQSVEVEWDVHATKDGDLLILDEMIGLAGDTAFDSLSLLARSLYDPVGVLSHLPKLALLLKSVEFSCAKVFDSIFGGDTDVIFPRLESLQLDGMSIAEYSVGPNVITPQRLPVLKKLWLMTMEDKDQQWVSNIFSGDEWPHLTNLDLFSGSDDLKFEVVAIPMPNLEHLWLSGCSLRLDIAEIGSLLPRLEHLTLSRCSFHSGIAAISSALPHLEHLSLTHCSFNLDFTTIASLLPRLEHLLLGDSVKISYDAAQVPQMQLTSLKSLIFHHYWSQSDDRIMPLPLLQFIVYGVPNLETIEVSGCGVSMDDVKTLSGQVNSSVHTLEVEFAEKRFNSESVAAMVAFFPNLKLFMVTDNEYEARKVLPGQHPNLEFDFYPAE
ncbi:RNI-like protein [Ramicandelaber brevisporus]|nr:RNI-like protein [Ramicandelaber brevisporus]